MRRKQHIQKLSRAGNPPSSSSRRLALQNKGEEMMKHTEISNLFSQTWENSWDCVSGLKDDGCWLMVSKDGMDWQTVDNVASWHNGFAANDLKDDKGTMDYCPSLLPINEADIKLAKLVTVTCSASWDSQPEIRSEELYVIIPLDYEALRRRVRDALNKTASHEAILQCAEVLSVKI